ncbi:hypothetical protein [Halogeometricum limi]|uniref:Uncharacterized protein n=1 Tax=Halogeometricum limi TaxID=555875 RepID=A0A1I6HCN7_9EURY|nr:hypothetical protein [Halogeometricum limi]SFR52138.1 hypothetical protein SAMN04488124_2056 [Halogeometricum limi]
MREQGERVSGVPDVLYGRAVVTPLPDEDAERAFHENMMRVADAQERKAKMLADPDVTLLEAYERQLEGIEKSYRSRMRSVAGEDYEAAAIAYARGDRDDAAAAISAYYLDALWRMQQRFTVSEMLFFPIILRYPDCFTVNVRFASGYRTAESVLYESPEHLTEKLEPEHAETYAEESLYTQKEAAKLIGAKADVIREEFPDPGEVPFEERKTGGIVSGGGRQETVFSSMLERVEPDTDRFDETPTEPTLVPSGPEAARTARELLPEGTFVI